MLRLHIALGLLALATAAPSRASAQAHAWRAVIDVEAIDAESVGGADPRAALARELEPGVSRCIEAALEGNRAAPRPLQGRLTLRARIRQGRVQRSVWTGDRRAPARFVRCLAQLAGLRIDIPLDGEVDVPFHAERVETRVIGALSSPDSAPPARPRVALTHESIGVEDEGAEEQLATMLRSRASALRRAYARISPLPVGRCRIRFGVRAETGTLRDRRVVCEEDVTSLQVHLERWADGLRFRPGTVTDGVSFEVQVELQGLPPAE